MPVLPVLSGHQVVRVFESFGWCIARQRGSPVILIVRDQGATLSVQDPREIAKGTLRSLVRATVLTVEAFVAEAEKCGSYVPRRLVRRMGHSPDRKRIRGNGCTAWVSTDVSTPATFSFAR